MDEDELDEDELEASLEAALELEPDDSLDGVCTEKEHAVIEPAIASAKTAARSFFILFSSNK